MNKKKPSKTINRDVLHNMGLRTSRELKQLKRNQIREIAEAFREYQIGCFHCPGSYHHVLKISAVLNEMTKSHSCKEWGN